MKKRETEYGTIRVAGSIMRLFLDGAGLAGIALPCEVAVILPEKAGDRLLIAHEDRHLKRLAKLKEQCGRWRGAAVYVVKHWWHYIKQGHSDSPWEKAARRYAERNWHKYQGLDASQ